MEIRGEEVLLPVSAVSAFPRPHWLQGRVLGSLSEPSYRSMNARVAYEDACKICAREQENAGLDILCDGAQYYEWEAPGFQLEPIFHFIPENLGGFAPYGPPGEGVKEVLLPGELEWRTEQQRRKEGIPLYDEDWTAIVQGLARAGLPAEELASKYAPSAS